MFKAFFDLFLDHPELIGKGPIFGEAILFFEALTHFAMAYGLGKELASPENGEEKVFYEDLNWYQERISALTEKLKSP